MRPRHRWLLAALLSLCVTAWAWANDPAHVQAQVVRVLDGDTVDVLIEGAPTRIRLINVGTPELSSPIPCVNALASQAKAFTAGLVLDQVVGLEFDVARLDVYKRLLAYVYVGDLMLNRLLLEQGLAYVATVRPNVRYREVFLALQRAAKAAKVGMWAGCRTP